MSSINTPDDVIPLIRGLKVDARVQGHAPRVFAEFAFALLRDVRNHQQAEEWVRTTLSRALRKVIGSEDDPEAVIHLALILWICEFLIGPNLRNALGGIADRSFMPIPNSSRRWKSLDVLFHAESRTIVGLNTKMLDHYNKHVYPVDVDAVGDCVKRFIDLISDHIVGVPVSADHLMIMLDVNEPVLNRWSETVEFAVGPIECIVNSRPIDEFFVHFLNLLTREYWGSSPELDQKLCRPPSAQTVDHRVCCAMYVVIVLVTFMLSYE